LPKGVELVLQLDDLPIEEPQLFDTEVFNELQENNKDSDDELEANRDSENNIEEKKLIPQIYMLSGGEITPFSLHFKIVENDYTEPKLHFKVTGLYTTPLTVEGPLFDDE
jgi:general secretion pathway protein H